MKRLVSCLLLVSMLVCLGACKKDTGEGKALAYPITADPACLDPQIASTQAAKTVLANCFEGLVRFDDQGAIAAGVAERWEVSANNTVYTFYLRRDAKWAVAQNEDEPLRDEVTAQDFVFALQRALSPQTGAPYAHTLYSIQNAQEVHSGTKALSALGVQAVDTHTLTITLRHADAAFLRVLTTAIAMPCHEEFFNTTGGRYGLSASLLLCNGPFALTKWTEDKSLVLKPHKGYAGNYTAVPASVTLRVNTNTDAYLSHVEDGTYCAAALPEAARPGEDDESLFTLQNRTLCLLFQYANALFTNNNLRMALVSAIDRGALSAGFGGLPLAQNLIPASCLVDGKSFAAYGHAAQLRSFDTAAAKNLLQKGLQELGLTSVSFTLLCSGETETAMRLVLQQWQQAFGLTVKASITVLPAEELADKVADRSYQVACYSLKASNDNAVDFVNQFSKASAQNPCAYASTPYQRVLDQLETATTAADKAAGCAQAQNHLLQNAVLLPLAAQESQYAIAPGVTGLTVYPDGETVAFYGVHATDN